MFAMALSQSDQQLIAKIVRDEIGKHRMTYSRAVSGSFQTVETQSQEWRREFWLSLSACGIVGAGWIVSAGVGYLAFVVHPDFIALPVIGSLGGSIAAAMATAYVNRELFGDVEIVADEYEQNEVSNEPILPDDTDPAPRLATVHVCGVLLPTASLEAWLRVIQAGDNTATIDHVRPVLGVAQRTTQQLLQRMRQHGWVHDSKVTQHGVKCIRAVLTSPAPATRPAATTPEVSRE